MTTVAISSCLLLFTLITVTECAHRKVVGTTGQNVTLLCKYEVKLHNTVPICWGRGILPNMGCGEQIVSTDGVREDSKKSDRYRLLGRLDDGDVSLTIVEVSETDSGVYGCRVAWRGLFNDDKHYIELTVEKATESTTSRTLDHFNSTAQSTSYHTQGQLNSTEFWNSSQSDSNQAAEGSSSLPEVLVCVLFVIVALASVVGALFIARRWMISKKLFRIPPQLVSSMPFRASVSSLGLHNRELAVENIYQMDQVSPYERSP